MKFRTEYHPEHDSEQIEHQDKLLTIGSCFAEHIGVALQQARFDVLQNPFGVLYNPASIRMALEMAVKGALVSDRDLIQHDGEWHSFYHHSSFSHHDKPACLSAINDQLQKTAEYLRTCRYLIITYGTAAVFIYQPGQKIVANCHKIPGNQFVRRRLSLAEVKDEILRTARLVQAINPEVRFIFSVSPVRHLKDGMLENQRNKATLILAISEMLAAIANSTYFPAYEILIDDLRDYRFYDQDLVHPGENAVQYIWEKFMETYCSEACRKAISDMASLRRALNHRPRNRQSPAHRRFLSSQLQFIEALAGKYPYLNFETERAYFSEQMAT